MKRFQIFQRILILTLSFSSIFTWAQKVNQKTDTVILINGNIITGEIKKFTYGILNYKMDGMGTVNIEVDKISSMKSKKTFEIRLDNGLKYFGSLDTSSFPRITNIVILNGRIPVRMSQIVEIYRLRKKFWARIDGNADLGFNYTKGSDIFQFNLSGNLTYRVKKYHVEFSTSTIFTNPKEDSETGKMNTTLSLQRYLAKNWYADVAVSAEINSELGLDLRLLTLLGVSHDLVHSMRQRLFFTLGANFNREWSNGVKEATINYEGLVYLQHKVFRYLIPKLDITTYIGFYPSFSIKDRYRLNFNFNAKLEVISAFYINLSLYDNYDSKPQGKSVSNNDWGTVLSVGVSF